MSCHACNRLMRHGKVKTRNETLSLTYPFLHHFGPAFHPMKFPLVNPLTQPVCRLCLRLETIHDAAVAIKAHLIRMTTNSKSSQFIIPTRLHSIALRLRPVGAVQIKKRSWALISAVTVFSTQIILSVTHTSFSTDIRPRSHRQRPRSILSSVSWPIYVSKMAHRSNSLASPISNRHGSHLLGFKKSRPPCNAQFAARIRK
jgi:hypothetical protein